MSKYNTKYTREILQQAVNESTSVAQVIRKLGLKEAGGNYSHIRKRLTQLGIDTSHFVKYTNFLVHGINKKDWSSILVYNKNGRREKAHRLRRAMKESGILYQCVKCGLKEEWNDEKLVLEVNHKDGNWLDNRKENLEFLCPNCHSQIPNHRAAW